MISERKHKDNLEDCIKFGIDKNGFQRFKNKKTGKVFTFESKPQATIETIAFAILLYFKGMTFLKIEDMVNYDRTTIMYWLDNYSEKLMENFKLSQIKDIKDLEIDEIFHFIDNKDEKEYLVLAIDRDNYEVVDYQLVESRTTEVMTEIIERIDDNYNVNSYHSDDFASYKPAFEAVGITNYTLTKNETTQIESFNSIVRGFCAPFIRKSKCVSRSLSKLNKRLFTFLFILNNKLKNSLDFKNFCINFASLLFFKRVIG